MQDDIRLFSANSPINRVWYFVNLFILGILVSGAHIGIKDYVIPNANPGYESPIKFFMYFIYFILTITFLMLIDRRIFDIFGARDNDKYITLSKIINISAIIMFVLGIMIKINVPYSNILSICLLIIASIFAIIVFIIGFIPKQVIEKPKKYSQDTIIFRPSRD